MAELEKHEKFDLRLNSQVKQVTHAPGNVTATFQNLKTRETDSVSGTVVSSYVNSNRGCYHRRRNRQKQRQRSSLLIGGRNSFISMPDYRLSSRMSGRIG